MQSGIDSSRLRIAAETAMPSKADTPADGYADAYPTQTASSCLKTATKAACMSTADATAANTGFFGPQGPSFRDVLDAINPLNQIPGVSDILASTTGHEPSTAAKLAGGAIGALIGGPISLVASLASIIFESGTGKSPANAVYAAVAGDTDAGEVQVAKADTAVVPVEATELASLEPAANSTANALDAANATARLPQSTNNPVLDLYGASTSSAHASYKKAQFLPYLRDVNHTNVM